MRKANKVIILLACSIFMICFAFLLNLEPVIIYQPVNMSDISDVEYRDKVEQLDTFVLYIYADSCSYCKDFTSQLDEILIEEQIQSFRILSDKNDAYYNTIKEQLQDKYQGTPSVYFYSRGELVDYFVGNYGQDIIREHVQEYKSLLN